MPPNKPTDLPSPSRVFTADNEVEELYEDDAEDFGSLPDNSDDSSDDDHHLPSTQPSIQGVESPLCVQTPIDEVNEEVMSSEGGTEWQAPSNIQRDHNDVYADLLPVDETLTVPRTHDALDLDDRALPIDALLSTRLVAEPVKYRPPEGPSNAVKVLQNKVGGLLVLIVVKCLLYVV